MTNKEFLTEQERRELRLRHRSEKDRRAGDRIKAILLADEGGTYKQVANALLIDEESVTRHVKEYQASKKLTIDHVSPGRPSKLDAGQTAELVDPLKTVTYVKMADVIANAKKWRIKLHFCPQEVRI
jgi:transposase